MINTTIEYKKQEFRVSWGYNEDVELYEIMIYPVHNGIVEERPVFLHRHPEEGYCEWRHTDICNHPERYLKKVTIEEVLDDDEQSDFYLWQEFLDKMNIRYKIRFSDENRYLYIHHENIKQVYGNAIELIFNENGDFIEFEAWGE